MSLVKRLVYTTFGSYDHVDADGGEISFSDSVCANRCPCCSSSLSHFEHSRGENKRSFLMQLCLDCGWWHLLRTDVVRLQDNILVSGQWWERYHAVLSELPIDSPNLSLDELQLHLLRKWDDRKFMSSQQAEDLVAGILKEHYRGDVLRVTANAFSADGGIDLFVVSTDGVVQRAVQVKRRQDRDTEPVQEIRNFVGAMLLHGSDNGVFVTTASRFTEPAKRIERNENLQKHRLSLKLIDGNQLLELLEHSNRRLSINLPPLVNFENEWVDVDGTPHTTRSLLFGDLRRLRR